MFLSEYSFVKDQQRYCAEQDAYHGHCHSFSDASLLKLSVDIC